MCLVTVHDPANWDPKINHLYNRLLGRWWLGQGGGGGAPRGGGKISPETSGMNNHRILMGAQGLLKKKETPYWSIHMKLGWCLCMAVGQKCGSREDSCCHSYCYYIIIISNIPELAWLFVCPSSSLAMHSLNFLAPILSCRLDTTILLSYFHNSALSYNISAEIWPNIRLGSEL